VRRTASSSALEEKAAVSVATSMDLYGTESIDDVQENYEKIIAGFT
jgi:hypothetical protein